MGCGSSAAQRPDNQKTSQQDQPILDKKIQKDLPVQPSIIEQLRNPEEGDEQKREKYQDDNLKELRKQTTPGGQSGTIIKKIVIIPPFDSDGNLQDEIKMLEIKADVQTNLKKMQQDAAMQNSQEKQASNATQPNQNGGKSSFTAETQIKNQQAKKQDVPISKQTQIDQQNASNKYVQSKSSNIQGDVGVKKPQPSGSRVILDMRDYILQKDLLKKAKDGLLEASEATRDDEEEDSFENVGFDQDLKMDSRILMEMEDDETAGYRASALNNFERNLLKEINLQESRDSECPMLEERFYGQVDLLKLIKEECNKVNQSEQEPQESELSSNPSLSLSSPIIQTKGSDGRTNTLNTMKQTLASNAFQDKKQENQSVRNYPQKSTKLLGVGKELELILPTTSKPGTELGRQNTFDTINDTISNASPINNSIAAGKQERDFNSAMGGNFPKTIMKKQETAMTEDLESLVKGLVEKPSLPVTVFKKTISTFEPTELTKESSSSKQQPQQQQQQQQSDAAKSKEAPPNKEMQLTIKNMQSSTKIKPEDNLQLLKKQSSIYQTSEKNSNSNLIADFQREDSREENNHEEFQISISSPLKKGNSKVLHTTSLIQDVDEDGKKKINNYTLVKELGRGNCGKVKLGFNEITHSYFAIKIANKDKLKQKLVSMKNNAFTLLEQEIAIMKKINHPNIVKLHEVIEDSEFNKLYIVMEFMQRGSILSSTYFKATLMSQDPLTYKELYNENGQIKNKLKEPKAIDLHSALKYMRQMALALDYMHNFANIVHRDIKPDNLLVDEFDNLKIADFGISQLMEERDETSSNAGTKSFMSPETWEQKVFKATPLDIWATGITLYMMIYGDVPFKEKKMMDLKNEICTKEIVLPPLPEIEDETKDFLFRMLDKNPETRITAKEMLTHPWLTNDGVVTLRNVIDHSLDVDNKDLEKAIGKCTKFTASVLIALGLKRVLKRTRQSLNFNDSHNGSILAPSPVNRQSLELKGKPSLLGNEQRFSLAKSENISRFSKMSSRNFNEEEVRQEKDAADSQNCSVSQILREDSSFNN